jgi:choline-sulfatase
MPVSLIDLLPTVLDLAGVGEEGRLPIDGQSLLGLIDGGDAGERVAFSEIHSEGIHGPCFMVRKGRMKYIYVHGHDDQLFDLEADPGEWHNLAGDPAYQEVRQALRTLILEQFDPDAIDEEVQVGIRRRRIVREAMNIAGTRWDVSPQFDGRKPTLSQYLP